jgi:hypothetical protein
MVEPGGIEPPTSCVQGRRSPSWAMAPFDWYSFPYATLLLLTRLVTYKYMRLHSLVARFAYENPFFVKLLCLKAGWNLSSRQQWHFLLRLQPIKTEKSAAHSVCVSLCLTPTSGWMYKKWWVWEDLNFRPHPYQGCALTNWATDPIGQNY